MRTAALIAAALAPLAAHAQSSQIAVVTISSNLGSVAGDLTNTTVNIPLSSVYTSRSLLHSVSSLYVTSAQGVPLNSIICTPFRFDNGTSPEGHAFSSSSPCLYKANNAELGSIVCISNYIAQAPPSAPSSSSVTQAVPQPSLTTKHKSQQHKTRTSTSTEGTMPATITITPAPKSGSGKPTRTAAAPSAKSTTATSSHPNVGNSLLASSEFFTGLALAGLGLAFAL